MEKHDPMERMIEDVVEDLKHAEEVSDKKVTKFGTSGHIILHKDHIGKYVKIIIHNRKKEKHYSMKLIKPDKEDNKKN